MKKIVRLTESELVRLVNRVINEQDGDGVDKFGKSDPISNEGGSDFDHFNKIVKPQLIQKGFKLDYDKNLVKYGTENNLIYGDHATGVNVLWDKMKGKYIVWKGSGNNKEFQLGGSNDSRSVANNVVKYASSLIGGGLNEQSDFDFTAKFPGSREFIGMEFPLFKDKNEKEIFYKRAQIGGKGVYPSHSRPFLMMQISDYPMGNSSGEPFTFDCSLGIFQNSRTKQKVYNSKISQKLLNGFCKSKVVEDKWNKPPEMEKISYKS